MTKIADHDHTSAWQTFDGMTKNWHKEYAPAKIAEPDLPAFTHLHKHAVNQCIEKANQMMLILFKQKLKPESEQII